MNDKMNMALRLAKEGRQEGFVYLRQQTYGVLMQKAMEILGDELAANTVLEQTYQQVFSRIAEVATPEQFEQWIVDVVVYFANQQPAQPEKKQDKRGFLHTAVGKAVLFVIVLAVAGGIVTGVLLHNKNKNDEITTEAQNNTEMIADQDDKTESKTEAATEATTEVTTETTTEEMVEEAVDYASVYLAILKREQDKITYYNQFRHEFGTDWTADYAESAPIALSDITGDGVPELLFIASQSLENNYVADLYVYTVENGDEKLILYESGWDVQVAGGSTYALFQIEGDSALYASNGMADDFTEENYYRYDVLANGNISKTELMTRYNAPNEDYTQTISTCTVNGSDATAEAFQNELDNLTGKITTLLIYNNSPFDDRAAEKMAQAEPKYMTYNEAVTYLSEIQ